MQISIDRCIIEAIPRGHDPCNPSCSSLFYANLKNGMAKGEALHNAKLTYLQNENLSSPYFWAAFIPAGDMQKIHFNNSNTTWYYLGGFALLILLGFGFYKRKKAA